MASTLPEWMTKEFFEQCLRGEEGNSNIVVTNLSASPAVPPGNNYGSFITRVALEWKADQDDTEMQSSTFVVKAELIDGPMKEVASECGLNEPNYYYKFIPKAKQFSETSFAPKSYFSPKPNVTILEDLKEKGFVMADRTKQLDFDHCRLYMIAAASFHAVSVPVFKKYPELLEPINREVMYSNESKSKDLFQLMIKGGMKKLAEEIGKSERFKKFSSLIEDTTPHLWEMLVEAHKPSEVVNTIRQGDPWVTNMMFRYDEEGKVNDIKLIDFQGTGYGSPVADLMMFIWSSANIDVKKNNLEELYRIYVESFNSNLEQFNCPERLTYEQMMEHVKKLSPAVLFMTGCFLPSVTHPEPMDFTALFSEDKNTAVIKFFEKYYTESYCSNVLPKVLETLEDNGIFTYLKNSKSNF